MRLPHPLPRTFDPVTWGAILQMDEATRTETAAYTAQPWDHTIRVDATDGAVTVTLPPAELCKGKVYVVLKADASANAVTVDGHASEEIGLPGATTVSTSTEGVGWTLQSTGSAWDIIGRTS